MRTATTEKSTNERELWIPRPQGSLQLQPSPSLIVQKFLLLDPTFLQVDKEKDNAETSDAQCRQEVEGHGVVVRRSGIDNCAGDDGAEKCRGVAS